MNCPVYYLISKEYYDNEIMHWLYKNNILSWIREKDTEPVDTEPLEIDTVDIDNLFEVLKEEREREGDNVYKIIHIHKNQEICGKFKVGDTIYLGGGMLSFYTKKINGEIDEVALFQTEIIKKEKITLYYS
jgi:hypothetical protein